MNQSDVKMRDKAKSIGFSMACCIGLAIGMAGSFALGFTLRAQDKWLTYYEHSGFLETPRYQETVEYCKLLADASPWLFFTSFGRSPEGRELPLLIMSKNQHFTPEAAHAADEAILLIQSCIHAGESDGKDASLMLVRDLAIRQTGATCPENLTVLFIPIFNVDGHEKFSAYHRPNQNGPKEMGFRATAQNLNLNRDFLKADAPEMRAWLALFNRWLPDLLVDNHVTDGTDHQYPLTYGIAKRQTVSLPLRQWTADVLEAELNERMAMDKMPIFPYFSQVKRPDLRRGIVHFPFSPRYSTGYGAIQNRIFYLVETHSLKNYRTRVSANYQLLKHIIDISGSHSAELKAVNKEADRQTALELAGRNLPLSLGIDRQKPEQIKFLGKGYDILDSEISGGPWIQFGSEAQVYEMPYFSRTIVADSVLVPYAYVIPAQWVEVLDLLKMHGVRIDRLAAGMRLPVRSSRLDNASWRPQPFEGRHLMESNEEIFEEEVDYPAGTAIVVLNQRTNRLIVNALEPAAPDSWVRWGFWNTIFEYKEYAEDYFLESYARQRIAAEPELAREFEAAVAADSSMKNSHWSMLYFFYKRSPYYEQRVNVYPVGRIMSEQDWSGGMLE